MQTYTATGFGGTRRRGGDYPAPTSTTTTNQTHTATGYGGTRRRQGNYSSASSSSTQSTGSPRVQQTTHHHYHGRNSFYDSLFGSPRDSYGSWGGTYTARPVWSRNYYYPQGRSIDSATAAATIVTLAGIALAFYAFSLAAEVLDH